MRPITFDIKEMIQLFSSGEWSYSALGRRYHKDHTTIMHHCQRLGLVKHRPVSEELANREFIVIETEELPPQVAIKYQHLMEETRPNPGKSYKEYLDEALKRPVEKRYHEIYYKHYVEPKVHHLALADLLETESP